MSKLDAVVCGLLSYQKKAPKQVWKDHGCNWQLRLESTKNVRWAKGMHTMQKKSLTSEREVLTTLEIDKITRTQSTRGGGRGSKKQSKQNNLES